MLIYQELKDGGNNMIDYIFDSIGKKFFYDYKFLSDIADDEIVISFRKPTECNTYRTLMIIHIKENSFWLGTSLNIISEEIKSIVEENIKIYKKYNHRKKVIDDIL